MGGVMFPMKDRFAEVAKRNGYAFRYGIRDYPGSPHSGIALRIERGGKVLFDYFIVDEAPWLKGGFSALEPVLGKFADALEASA